MSETHLRPMNSDEYPIWYAHCVQEFAHEKSQALGIPIDQAQLLSEKSFSSGLPDGLETPDNYLFTVVAENDDSVGVAWIKISTEWGNTSAFIYDIEIHPAFRSLGFGTTTMKLLEQEAKKHGATKIALHVFGFNETAIALYKKTNYQITDLTMAKEI